MILNDGLDFVKIASDTDQKAFTEPPVRILINARTLIYRWTDHSLSDAHAVAPWWLFLHSKEMPGGETFDGFDVHRERARRLGKTDQEYARVRLALSEKFNNKMTRLVVAGLKVNVWAFWGKVSGQHEFKNLALNHIFLIGGAAQLYIPDLRFPEHLRVESDHHVAGSAKT